MKTALWIIIGIIVVALIATLAFGLGNGVDQENDLAPETVETATTTADLAQVRADAAADLAALRVRAEAGETYEELAGDYAAVRARVAAAYQNAGAEAAEEWQEVEAGFDEFEAAARAGTSSLLDDFATLIARFSADVGTDSEGE